MRMSHAATLTALATIFTAGAASAQELDREAIVALTDTYVAAVVAHDPSAAPLSPDVRFVENITRLQPGEGLWSTATAASSTFAIHVPDVANQSAGFIGVMQRPHPPLPENPTEAQVASAADGIQDLMVAIRLKLENGQIVEAEHIVTPVGNLDRLQTPRPGLLAEVPEDARKPHDELAAIGMTYYDALDDNDGSLMPFADDCQRHENGFVTAGPEAGGGPNADPEHPIAKLCGPQLDSQSFVYIARIENRRMAAADPTTGLVMGLSHFRHPFDNLPYTVVAMDGTEFERNSENMPYEPFDMPAAHIFKIGADGLVHEIEAVGVTVRPYNSPTGWE